ncbi:hypothetical protein niasHT_032029 [Heterodera trifolii]|uniref:Uncharacterized protein n=1 Tax=Heterodera trifolii TaxID=157864 RepID=A0ABD2I9K9_9BILA
MSSPIDAILGKENADPEAGAKTLKAKGSNKPKVPPANIAEIQAELGKAKEEILSAVSTYISEAMSTVNRGMEGFTAAIRQMANALDASRAREEMEQMSLDDPDLEDVSIEAGETGKEPEKPTDGENDPGETPQGHQGPKGIPLAQEHSVRERGRGTGHGRAFVRGRGGHCRGQLLGPLPMRAIISTCAKDIERTTSITTTVIQPQARQDIAVAMIVSRRTTTLVAVSVRMLRVEKQPQISKRGNDWTVPQSAIFDQFAVSFDDHSRLLTQQIYYVIFPLLMCAFALSL